MRRPLHSLLIGVLICLQSGDVARACWHQRRAYGPVVCPPVAWVPMSPCGPPHGSWVVVPMAYVIDDAGSCVSPAVGCCGGEVVVGVRVVSDVKSALVTDAVGTARPIDSVPPAVPTAETPTPAEPVAVPAPTAAAERPRDQPEAVAAVPDEPQLPELQPAPQPAAAVKPASNDEPAVEPAPPVAGREEPPVSEPRPPVKPAPPPEENLFEKVEGRSGDAASTTPESRAEEPVGAATEGEGGAAAADPQPVPPAPAGSDDPPAAAEALEPPPAASTDESVTTAREPLRRWIDASGTYAVVGAVVAFGGDRVVILRNDGREISVPLERLSEHDRAYARTAGERLAARLRAAPPIRETVGL